MSHGARYAMGLLTGCGGSKEKENMKIYYINALGDGIGAVGYHMDATKTDAMIDEALQALATDPDSVDYRKTISDSIKITDRVLDNGLLSLYFDREYEELTGYTEVLMRAAIVKTLVQIKESTVLPFMLAKIRFWMPTARWSAV